MIIGAALAKSLLVFAAGIFYAHSPTNNLGDHRVIFEIRPITGQAVGIVVPRTRRLGARLLVYRGSESVILGSSSGGSDLITDVPYRFSASLSKGELAVRINNRRLTIPAAALGVGALNWRRFDVRGDAAFPFSIDNVLFFNGGSGLSAAPDGWTLYD